LPKPSSTAGSKAMLTSSAKRGIVLIAGLCVLIPWCAWANQDQKIVDDVTSELFLGDISSAKSNITRISNISLESSGGLTVLLVVAMIPGLTDESLVDQILALKPDLDTPDPMGITALYYAASQGKLQLLDKLLKAGAKVNSYSYPGSALVGAAWNGQTAAAERLLEEPTIKVDLAEEYGRTALYFAILHSDSRLVRSLLQQGANPNIYEVDEGNTPLILAAAGSVDVVRALLLSHANPRFKNPVTCDSVMHAAVKAQNIAVVEFLLKQNVRADVTDWHGITPLGIAKNLKNAQLAEILTKELEAKNRRSEDAGEPTTNCADPGLLTLAHVRPQLTLPSAGDFMPMAIDSVATWSASKQIFLSPDFPSDVSYQIWFFHQIICSARNDPETVKACQLLMANPSRVSAALAEGFDEMFVQRKKLVQPLAARLSASIGIDFSRAGYGWNRNTIACQQLPAEYDTGLAYLVYKDALVRIPRQVQLCFKSDQYDVVVPAKKIKLTLQFSREANTKNSVVSTADLTTESDLFGRVIVAPSEHVCMNQGSEQMPLTRPIPRRDDIVIKAPKSFSTATTVRLTLSDPARMCDRQCALAVRNSVIKSIMLWKTGCSRCSLGNLLFIKFEDAIYFNDQTVQALQTYVVSGRPFPKPGDRYVFTQAPFLLAYKKLDRSLAEITSLCAVKPTKPFDELCADPKASDLSEESELTVEISDSANACKTASAIACASPEGSIQLRAHDHIFALPSEHGSLEFGRSGRKFDLTIVLLHELGHFFGLPHLDSKEIPAEAKSDIMAPAYHEAGECVTKSDFNMLNQAVDPRWSFVLKGCAGLTFTPDSPRPR